MFTLEISWILSAAILITILIKWLLELIIEVAQHPPGPWGLPIVGYIPWIGLKPHESFIKIGKKYGGIFSVRMGETTVVVLNDWPTIKASMVDQGKIFSGRPYSPMVEDFRISKAAGFQDGAVWVKQRNLVIQCLKKMGIGKNCLESVMMDSVHDILETFSQSDQNVIKMDDVFFGPIMKFNVKLILDRSMGNNDEGFKVFSEAIRYFIKELKEFNPIFVFPWLRFIPPIRTQYKKLMEKNDIVCGYLKKAIDDHLGHWSNGFEQDFVDHYLSQIQKMENTNSKQEPPYDCDHLLGSLVDLIYAGVDTTNSTLRWGFLYLAHSPEVQTKAQEQLDSVVGRHRLPNLDDFSRLPYIDAMIMEIHRLAIVVPLSIPHMNSKTTKINGWTIPKGTTCFQNIYAVHRDPKLWDEPDRFNPERFLTANGEAKALPYLMPFSIGPRLCVGQPLAEMELKLIFSCLLHRFSFSLPTDRPKPTLESGVGITVHPCPYSLLIQARND